MLLTVLETLPQNNKRIRGPLETMAKESSKHVKDQTGKIICEMDDELITKFSNNLGEKG
jgi:hypothetical protein